LSVNKFESEPNTIRFPAGRDAEPLDDQRIRSEVIDSMEQGVIVWSDCGVCELVNSRYYRLMGEGRDYLHVGMRRAEYFQGLVRRGDATQEMVERLEASLSARQPFSIERQAGTGAMVAVYIRPMQSGGHVVTYTDITETKKSQEALSLAIERAENAERSAREALTQEQDRRAETRALSDLSDWLQCCKSIDELYEIVRQAMASMFVGSGGQLFIYSNSRDVLDGAVTWGDIDLIRSIQPQDCWSLRRGRLFQYGEGVVKLACNHVPVDAKPDRYLCLPIIAQGDTVGMLHIAFESDHPQAPPIDDNLLAFAQRCSEQISMAIANVKLRDELHEQSTRDPLTGLYNRRYFLERSRSAISLVERDGGTLALISLDADNFKSYNDNYGHDAGDYLLCSVGELTRRFFNNDEVCCRIGGEEFSILIPDCDSASAVERAAEFIQCVECHEFRYQGQLLPTVTVSAGVAAYPEHADSLQTLCKLADVAMYDAKELGKNRVCLPGTHQL
jgi:diguanylate cyclase (GGDEF)-like protein